MLHRLLAVVIMTVFMVGCGGDKQETKREGVKAAAAAKPEASEEGAKIQKQLDDADKAAKKSVIKEPVEKPPLKVQYFVYSEAFDATGYRWESLKKEIQEKDTKGTKYVKVLSYNGVPESADVYDDMGNHLNIVAYLWEKDFTVKGSVYKSASDRMLGMFLYCKGTTDLFVHDLSTFRVHAPYARKLTFTDTALTVQYVDGHDEKGELPVWPECKDVAAGQEKAGPYQSPWGVHRETFSFDADNNLLSVAHYDLKGELVEDLHGIAKQENGWAEGELSEIAYYSKDGLLSKFIYTYNDKGKLTAKAVVDTAGKPTIDYFGAAFYEYEYDKRGRVEKEVRMDVARKPIEVHTFDFAKFSQVAAHKVFDGAGNPQTALISEYNKKGARLSLKVYDGDPAAGKLKLDFNGVAMYKFDYTDKGKALKESRHGTTQVVGADGNPDYLLKNGLDTWALIENFFDQEGLLEKTEQSKVDGAGNIIFVQGTNKEGQLTYTLENTYVENALTRIVRTEFTNKLPTKKIFMDGKKVVAYVALLEHNSDGLLMQKAFFQEDGKTPVFGPEEYHKMTKSYREDQKPLTETYFDTAGVKVKTRMFEYAEDGKFKGIKLYDAEGNAIKI